MLKRILYNLRTLLQFRNLSLVKYMMFKQNLFSGNISVMGTSRLINSKLYGKIEIDKNTLVQNTTISCKNNFIINEGVKIYGAEINGSNIEIGRYTSLWGPNIFLFQKKNPVKIGSFCSIARGVSMQEYNHNHKKITSYYIGKNIFKEYWDNENISSGAIEIGHDVWIGANTTILSGTKIGNGCVVAANAVLNKEYPPYSIIGGIPANVIGHRFEETKVRELETMKWWDWSIEKIKEHKAIFEHQI